MRVLKLLGRVLGSIILLIALAMATGGLIFLGLTVIAGLTLGGAALFGSAVLWTVALTTLKVCLWIYLPLVIFTFLVMETFGYQNCCIGLDHFSNHLQHTGTEHLSHLATAIFWPLTIRNLDAAMASFGSGWVIIVLSAIEYWFISRWKGTAVVAIDCNDGQTTVDYITPETATETLLRLLKEQTRE